MNWSAKYYTENLYPFQDGVLNIVKKSGAPFYLTGGTALSRGYFNHRYSDDLDLFVNQDDRYPDYVQTLFRHFEIAQKAGHFTIDYNRLRRFENFTQFFLIRTLESETIELKIDVVNDVASHDGEFEEDATMGRLDSWRNILSNKLSAIFR
jgi:predicted nucleotidyltransferase component of viral defense system